MKTIAKVGIGLSKIGKELFSELCGIYPQGRDGVGLFRFQHPLGDPITIRLLELLREHGMEPQHPWEGTQDYSRTFHMELKRDYDEADYRAAQYLEPLPTISFDSGRTADGLIMLVSEKADGGIQPGVDIADAMLGNGIVVSDHLRWSIQNLGFSHVMLRETVLDEPPRRPLPGPYWQLWSDLILPPLSPHLFLYDESNQPFDGDYDRNWYLREGKDLPEVLIFPPEMRYEPGVLEALPPFDLALTHELLGSTSLRRLVASQRFYRFCTDKALPMRWRPVRTDPSDPPPVIL